jgi:hypothetical protein
MKEYPGDSPGNPIRFRRPDERVVIVAICGVFTLLALITCSAVAVAMAAMFHGFGPSLDGLFTGLFARLFEGIGIYLAAVLLFLLRVFVVVTDLLTMLSMGQFIPFFLRLAQLVGSM